MKIVITHTDFRLYWPARISALQRALERRGDELHIIEIAGAGSPYAFSQWGGAEAKNWICLFPATRMEDISPARASGELWAKLNELSPDVVMGGGIAYPSGATAVRWAKNNNRPVIIFDDARLLDVPRGSVVNYIKQLIYEQVDAVLCPAPPWTEVFVRWRFRPEQVFFGVDVVDNDFWGGYGGPRLAELPDGYLLAVGRQIPVKNFGFLLRVYETYRSRAGPEASLPLVLVGEGPERDAMEAALAAGHLEQVCLLPFVDPSALRALYQHAAALVMPSLAETWGLVVNEAMAAGLPVLVSNACGCAPVLVREAVNGYTFSPDRPDELLDILLAFTARTSEEKAAMGRASRRQIRSWGLDRFVSGSLDAIAYAIANKKTCRSVRARFVLRHWKGRYRPV
jgi:glycosyltransferase involved in cell wall biosynthesis